MWESESINIFTQSGRGGRLWDENSQREECSSQREENSSQREENSSQREENIHTEGSKKQYK
jgi:hypothetical protein